MKRLVVAWMFLVAGCGPNGGTFHPKHDGGLQDASVACVNGPKDTDGDGISDKDEGAPNTDTDHDGVPDYLDDDSDNDGIPDAVEGRNGGPCFPPVDSDGDGKPDFQDLDSDSATDSTVGDAEEAGANPAMPVDTNGDGKPDYMDPDNDGDGINDVKELTPQGGMVAATKLAMAPDTDGDGVPDFLDDDSDNDTILDSMEGSVDTDGNGIPNYRDLDSDGDCISDQLEAGRADKHLPPVDTNGNNVPDFLDLDSDGDGLLDKLEDTNCNGKLDPCEYDRINPTTNHGINDLISYEDCSVKSPAVQAQLNCQCWGTDPTNSPLTAGDFVFVVDYMKPPTPSSETLNLSTDVSNADVIFSLDTTGSMQGSLNNLATNLSSLVPQIQAKVKNVAFGVVSFKDYRDLNVVQYNWRITTVLNGTAGVQGALNALKTAGASGGGDAPEAGWEALYAIAGGPPLVIHGPTAWISTFNLASVAPNPVPAGEMQGTLGGAGFRAGAVPIVVTVTDANQHDAWNAVASGYDGVDDWGTAATFNENDCPIDTYPECKLNPSRKTSLNLLKTLNAHVVGLAGSGGGASGNPKLQATGAALDTGAVVNVADFGPVGTRPAGCAINQCCTGLNGAGETDNPAGSGNCPLAFTFDDATGNGASSGVVAGIVALANGLKFDIHVQAVDVDPMTVDNFMLELVPNLSGMGPAAVCITVPPQPLQDNFTGPKATPGPDSVLDTFPGISGGKQICFDVVPKMNTTVMETSAPQFFHAQLQVKGVSNGTTVNLGTPRDVFFLVPPMIVNGQIP